VDDPVTDHVDASGPVELRAQRLLVDLSARRGQAAREQQSILRTEQRQLEAARAGVHNQDPHAGQPTRSAQPQPRALTPPLWGAGEPWLRRASIASMTTRPSFHWRSVVRSWLGRLLWCRDDSPDVLDGRRGLEQQFSVSTGARERFQIVVVQGDLDAAPAAELDDAIEGCPDELPVIIDLSGVDAISSAGLDVLLRDRRAGTALVCPPGNVMRLFEVVRTNRRVPIFKDLDSAVQSIALGRFTRPGVASRKPLHEGARALVHAREATQPPAYV